MRDDVILLHGELHPTQITLEGAAMNNFESDGGESGGDKSGDINRVAYDVVP